MSLNLERKIIDFFSINKQILLFCSIFIVFCAFSASSQSKQEQYLEYIERFKDVALEQEREFGVPASITLAQGILESSVGQSKMAREANNHFGIKAYNWDGEVYGQSGVGYRKYVDPEESYLDHSRVLAASRYSILYQFDVTDYRSWAQGLRDCGYAEDVNYPSKLINIIEQYELYALNGGTRIDGKPAVQVDEESENTGSSRWYHRKRRNRTRQQEPAQEQSAERQQSFTPLQQGHVPASVDND